MSGVRVVVKESAMSWDLQQDCVDCAAHAIKVLKLNDQTAIAQFMKKELDSKYGQRWHCIVGHSFGSVVGHDTEYCIYFSIDDIYFLVWRVDNTREETLVKEEALRYSQDVRRAKLPPY